VGVLELGDEIWTQSAEVAFVVSFSEQLWVWNGVHSALVRINEELLERKVAAPV
jgi:hypothetical protein